MFMVRPRGQTERGIKRERTLRTATDLVYKDSQLRGEGGGDAVEKDKRRLGERRAEGEEAGVRGQRKGCSRMRQDLITPYNVLFCGCLAYTPVPVCRLGNTVNTPMALFLLLLLSCLLSHSLLSIFSSLTFVPLALVLVVVVVVVVAQVWVVCVYVP